MEAEVEEAGRKIDREQRGRAGSSGRVAAVGTSAGETEIEMAAAATVADGGGSGPSSSGQQDRAEDDDLLQVRFSSCSRDHVLVVLCTHLACSSPLRGRDGSNSILLAVAIRLLRFFCTS
jgi:hypothetical protein